MFKKDPERIKEIKEKVSEFSLDAIELALCINSISEIIFDYCAYNVNTATGNIMTLAEILKRKSEELINLIDSEDIKITNL